MDCTNQGVVGENCVHNDTGQHAFGEITDRDCFELCCDPVRLGGTLHSEPL